MRYLITGGAGFIGSHLTERLVAAGHAAVVLDDFSTGRRANLAALANDPRLDVHAGSAADADLVRTLLAGCDGVVHLAADVGVRRVLEHTAASIDNNLRPTQVVLEAATEQRKKVLLASSSEVYGKSQRLPLAEDDDLLLGATTGARWSYACAKAMGEWLALAHARERGLRCVVARLFNTVGPRQRSCYGMVLPTFVDQALAGEPLTVHGDGTQTRCFAHVHDVVAALSGLLHDDRAAGRVLNVGSDREVSIGALAEMVRELTGSASAVVHVPYRRAYEGGLEDLPRRVPDLRRLRSVIGERPWQPLRTIVGDVVAERRAAALVAEIR